MTPRDALDACHHLAWAGLHHSHHGEPSTPDQRVCGEIVNLTDALDVAASDEDRARGYVAAAIRLLRLAEHDGDRATAKAVRKALAKLEGLA